MEMSHRPRRRLRGGLRAIAHVGLLTLGFAVVASWIVSYLSPSDYLVSWRLGPKRYTLRAQRGWFSVFAPPTAPSTTRGDAERLIGRMSNKDFCWRLSVLRLEGGRVRVIAAGPAPLTNPEPKLVSDLRVLSAGQSVGLLLGALEDPDRFAAAHIWLLAKTRTVVPRLWLGEHGGQVIVIPYGDLRVELRPVFPPPTPPDDPRSWQKAGGDFPLQITCNPGSEISIDPAQLAMLRRAWHDRLDVRIIAVPHAIPATLLLLAPIVWVWNSLRRRRRVRRGCCPDCGYDLRSSENRCPECGEPTRPSAQLKANEGAVSATELR